MTAFDAPDLFAGPGGWDIAAVELGLRTVGLEWDPAACRTRGAAGHPTIRCDVAAYPTAPFAGMPGHISSAPCQPWSRAGKGGGKRDQALVHQAVHDLAHGRDTRETLREACSDPRSLLAAEPMRWLADLRPEWVAMEEVPDVLPLWRHYAEVLRGWGYSVWVGILNAADYGVPQTRRRAILIASQVRAAAPPAPTHTQHPAGDLFGETLLPWVSMAEALDLAAGWVLHTNRDQRADGTRQTADPAGGPAPTFTVKSGGQWVLRSGNQANAAIRAVDQPVPTMAFGNNSARVEWVKHRPATTVCATDRITRPGHRDRGSGGESQFASPETVRITVEEAAVLQGFPGGYGFVGTKTKQFEQIGNAMPPPLAMHVLSAATGIPVPQAAALATAP